MILARDAEVLHCYRTFYPESQGGLEHSILEISGNIPSSNVLTLSSNPGRYSLLDNRVLVQACKRWFSVASCCVGGGLLKALARDKAELLHFHFPWPFGDIAYLLAGRRRPLVITYHSDVVRQRFLGALYRPLMRQFFRRADRIVATSQNYVDSSEVLREFQNKVTVIPLGISEDNYPSPPDNVLESIEARFGHGFMLFVGVLRYYKGLDYLIRAAVDQPYKVVIAGKGPEFERLNTLANDVGANNVIFAGYVSDSEKVALLQLCRGLVFPSHLRSEAFGVTLLEGMMYRKPLISCEIGTGTSYVNKDGETGFVVNAGDVTSLQQAMFHLWEQPDIAHKMGEAGRRRFETCFTARKMADAYQVLYGQILVERGLR